MGDATKPKSIPRRIAPLFLWAIFIACLLYWPFTRRYTTFGLDIERPTGPLVECTYYRIRWPGDGSIMFGWIDEHHSAARKPASGWDFGGRFFQPPTQIIYGSEWNRLGFWLVKYDHLRDAGPCAVSPLALRADLIGVPYALVVVLSAGVLCVGLRYL